MSASDHEMKHYIRTYLNVFAALMALTVITVGASYVQLAVPLAIAVALVIAMVKGALVASVFMHLVSERPAIFAVVLITAVLLRDQRRDRARRRHDGFDPDALHTVVIPRKPAGPDGALTCRSNGFTSCSLACASRWPVASRSGRSRWRSGRSRSCHLRPPQR